jgi:hypothetical protein
LRYGLLKVKGFVLKRKVTLANCIVSTGQACNKRAEIFINDYDAYVSIKNRNDYEKKQSSAK